MSGYRQSWSDACVSILADEEERLLWILWMVDQEVLLRRTSLLQVLLLEPTLLFQPNEERETKDISEKNCVIRSNSSPAWNRTNSFNGTLPLILEAYFLAALYKNYLFGLLSYFLWHSTRIPCR